MGFLLRRTVLGCVGFVLVLGAVFALFQRIPGSLVPAEDQGYVFMVTVLPPAAAISRTREVTKEATAALMKNPAVANVVTFSGFDLLSRALKTNSGISFVTLKDWSQRTDPKEDARNVAPALARHQRQLQGRRRRSASTRRRSWASASPAASNSSCRTARAAR